MDLVIYTLADEELKRVESLIENTIPKIEALVPEYMKIYNELYGSTSTPEDPEEDAGSDVETGVPKSKDLKAKYREAALKAHPDRGGDEEVFKELSSAYREGDKVKFMNAYNKARGNQADVLNELINTNGYKWALMYEDGKIAEVRKAFLQHLLNEIYQLETKG